MNRTRVVFYDTSRAYYASYYLNGFRTLEAAGEVQLQVQNSIPAHLAAAVKNPDWQDLLFAMVLFSAEINGQKKYFCIDTHDANSLSAANETAGFHLPLLESVDAYFKVNHNPAQIEATPALHRFAARIYPIAQFFPVTPRRPLAMLKRVLQPPVVKGYKAGLGHNHPYAGHWADTRRRIRDIRNFESLENILRYRETEKDIDIFFVAGFSS